MENLIVESTKRILIKKFGDPEQKKMVSGLPVRVINKPLEYYTQIIEGLQTAYSTQELELDNTILEIVSKSIETAIEPEMENLKNLIARFSAKNPKKSKAATQKLELLTKELADLSDKSSSFALLSTFENCLKAGKCVIHDNEKIGRLIKYRVKMYGN